MYCEHQHLHNDKLDMNCENGMVFNGKAAKFGVISNEFKFYGYCTEEAIQSKIKKEDYQSCSSHMLQSKAVKIKEDLIKYCHGQTSCQIDYAGIMNPADNAMQAYCNDEAIFYMQAPCVIP